MIINTKSYPDFKALASKLRHIDGVFYNTVATIPSSTFCVIYAYDRAAGICVQCSIYTGLSPPDAATIQTDFPGAVLLSEYLSFSAQSLFSL